MKDAAAENGRDAGWALAGQMLLLYLLLVGVLVWLAARGSAGFSYSLDDPYIHLALAQRLLHGTYGINAGETSSPASSVLWPLLLTPFAETTVRQWVPLAWNLIFGAGTCAVLGLFVRRWWPWPMPVWVQWPVAAMCVVAANLGGLALIGMEHTLQVMLAACCASALAEMFAGRRAPAWALAAAALAPAVRYEDLAFLLAVVLALWWGGRRRAASAVTAGGLAPLVAMGWFLHRHGLGWLPNSVVVKGGVISARIHLLPQYPLLDHALTIVAVNLRGYVLEADRWPITLFVGILTWQVWARWDVVVQRRALLGGCVGLVLLLFVGPYGYQYRYDVAYRLFGMMLVLAACAGMRWWRPAMAATTLLLGSVVYGQAMSDVPLACFEIAHEQKQMQRFAQTFYGQTVAINDLGWVSFDDRDRFYVLDLAGLASNEASHQRVKDAVWLDGITQEHHAGLAMVYRWWFVSIPQQWTEIAVLKREGPGSNKVWFYATSVGNAAEIRNDLRRFERTLPQGTTLEFSKLQVVER